LVSSSRYFASPPPFEVHCKPVIPYVKEWARC
jgi:hypothetical protein